MDRGSGPVGRRGRGGRGASLTARPITGASAPDAASPSATGAPSSVPVIKREPTTASAGSFRGRFRPKNVRRSEAERAAIAEQEAQKQRERAAEEAKAKPRGRFRGGRSRGNAMGQRGRIMNPTGMFAQRGGMDARGKGRADTDPRSRETTTSRFENHEPRINVDKLGLPAGAEGSDPEDNFDFYDEDDKFPGLAPMGIYRTKPKKETVTVTTAAEIETEANGAGSTESSSENDDEVDFKTAISSAKTAGPKVAVHDVGNNEINFDRGRKAADAHIEDDEDIMDIDIITDPAKAKKKKAAAAKALAPVDLETEQLEADLRLMRNEFSWMKIRDEFASDDQPADDDAAAIEAKVAEEGIMREGRVYLFQFPPVMPPLRPVKPGAAAGARHDAMSLISDDGDDDEAAAAAAAAASMDNQSGCVGQMVVRRSGRVEMNWGGITYEMRPALKRDFVTSAVLVEYSDEKRRGATHGDAQQQQQSDGRAVGLGRVMGQFILAPKYEDTSEWVISPEDLKAPGEAA